MDCGKCWLADRCNHKNRDADFCLRKYKLDSLYGMSLLSEAQRARMTLFADDDGTDYEEFKELASIQENIVGFVQKGGNLYLHSNNCGNGKTSWALRLVQAYFDKIWPAADISVCHAMFISVPRLLIALKESISFKNEYADFVKQHVSEADLVVWDDIAAKAGTEFELNHLLSMVDERISAGKANIYTTNLGKDKLTEALGERLSSRIGQYGKEIELTGRDKRNLGGRE